MVLPLGEPVSWRRAGLAKPLTAALRLERSPTLVALVNGGGWHLGSTAGCDARRRHRVPRSSPGATQARSSAAGADSSGARPCQIQLAGSTARGDPSVRQPLAVQPALLAGLAALRWNATAAAQIAQSADQVTSSSSRSRKPVSRRGGRPVPHGRALPPPPAGTAAAVRGRPARAGLLRVGLAEVVVDAQLGRVVAVLLRDARGDHDHRQVARRASPRMLRTRSKPSMRGISMSESTTCGAPRPGARARPGRPGGDDAVALAHQQALGHAAHGERVVDHQHQRRGDRRPGGTPGRARTAPPSARAAHRAHARCRRTAWPAPPGCRSARPPRRAAASCRPGRAGATAAGQVLTTTSWLPSTSSTCSATLLRAADHDHRAGAAFGAAAAVMEQRAEPEERQRVVAQRCCRWRTALLDLVAGLAAAPARRASPGTATRWPRRSAASPPASPPWSAAARA